MEAQQHSEDLHYTVQTENILEELRERPQWVVWRYEERNGKLTKVPYSPLSFERASSTDLMTWSPFDVAVTAYKVGDFDGIGFVFCSGDGFVGIDIDDCRDPETGELEPWAQAIVNQYPDAYMEASPSGRGVHIFARGRLRGGKRRGPVEVYGQDRFFTVTGVAI